MDSAEFIARVIAPFFYPLYPGQRIYWLYLLAAIGIVFVIYLASRRTGRPAGFLRFCFPREVFLHRSAINDYGYFILNKGIIGLALLPFAIGPGQVSAAVQALLAAMSGYADGAGLMAGPTTAIWLTLLSVLAMDAAIFWTHYLQHKLPLLWEFHKVHHSAEVLTPITIYRMHPVDILLTSTIVVAGIGTVRGVFAFLYGDPVTEITVMEVNVILFAFYLLSHTLRHSHIWLSFPGPLSHLLVSPAQHQIHHSAEPRHFDRNFGFVFAYWDWLAGSLYVPQQRERFSLGLDGGEHADYSSVWRLYGVPFAKSWGLVRRLLPGRIGAAARR